MPIEPRFSRLHHNVYYKVTRLSESRNRRRLASRCQLFSATATFGLLVLILSAFSPQGTLSSRPRAPRRRTLLKQHSFVISTHLERVFVWATGSLRPLFVLFSLYFARARRPWPPQRPQALLSPGKPAIEKEAHQLRLILAQQLGSCSLAFSKALSSPIVLPDNQFRNSSFLAPCPRLSFLFPEIIIFLSIYYRGSPSGGNSSAMTISSPDVPPRASGQGSTFPFFCPFFFFSGSVLLLLSRFMIFLFLI